MLAPSGRILAAFWLASSWSSWRSPSLSCRHFGLCWFHVRPSSLLKTKNNYDSKYLHSIILKRCFTIYNLLMFSMCLFDVRLFWSFWVGFGPRDLTNRFPPGQISILTNYHQNPMARTPNRAFFQTFDFLKNYGNLFLSMFLTPYVFETIVGIDYETYVWVVYDLSNFFWPNLAPSWTTLAQCRASLRQLGATLGPWLTWRGKPVPKSAEILWCEQLRKRSCVLGCVYPFCLFVYFAWFCTTNVPDVFRNCLRFAHPPRPALNKVWGRTRGKRLQRWPPSSSRWPQNGLRFPPK